MRKKDQGMLGSVTLKAMIVTLTDLNFEGQLSSLIPAESRVFCELLPIKPIKVLGYAGCSSMVVMLGLAEVCC